MAAISVGVSVPSANACFILSRAACCSAVNFAPPSVKAASNSATKVVPSTSYSTLTTALGSIPASALGFNPASALGFNWATASGSNFMTNPSALVAMSASRRVM